MCSREELGLDGSTNSTFLPIHPGSYGNIDLYRKKFLCVDPEDMYIFGNFESYKARLMNVQLIKCNNETRVE